MAITKNANRRAVNSAIVEITLAMLATGVDLAAIVGRAGEIVVGGYVLVTEVFDSTTSDVLDVGDSGSQNRYKNDIDLQALGLTALVPTGYNLTPGQDITVRWVSGGGTPTTGALQLLVQTVNANQADYSQR